MDDGIHVWVRINSGRPGFSHENGPSRLAQHRRRHPVRDGDHVDAAQRHHRLRAAGGDAVRGALANNLCLVHAVQESDLDEDGIPIGPGVPGPQGATFGDVLHADLGALDGMALAGHAITNDRERRVSGRLTEDEHPPANALAVHPGIIGVSVVAPACGDAFHPGARISVAVRHSRSARVTGSVVPGLSPAWAGTCARPALTGRAS